jgi:hypothetical protein
MVRIARLVFTFVLAAAGALLVAPSAMAGPAEVTRVTEVRDVGGFCSRDFASVDVTVTFVFIQLSSADQKLLVTAHGSVTTDTNKWVVNQRLDFLIHTEDGRTNSIFTNTLLAVSQGSEPNEFFTITANTETGETTLEQRCVG